MTVDCRRRRHPFKLRWRDKLGSYQAHAAIAALHADAPSFDATDWVQIVEWYDKLPGLGDSPLVPLNRAVAVGQADGALTGLAALTEVDRSVPRWTAFAAHLRHRDGELAFSAQLYAQAALETPNLLEREHQTRQAARIDAGLHDH